MALAVFPTEARTPSGLTIVTTSKWDDLKRRLRAYDPKSELGKIVKECFRYLPADLAGEMLDAITRVVVVESSLALVHIIPGRPLPIALDYGVVGKKVVTTAGVNAIVDAFQNSVELENFKYHAFGTGTVAEAVGDTALGTEVETRATGTTEEGGTANVFKTVGTVAFTASRAITEHGVFSASTSGTLLDRTMFSASTINVVSGDSIQATYQLTFTAGS